MDRRKVYGVEEENLFKELELIILEASNLKATVKVIEVETLLSSVEQTINNVLTARVFYKDRESRNELSRILVKNGWKKSSTKSDDFYLRISVPVPLPMIPLSNKGEPNNG